MAQLASDDFTRGNESMDGNNGWVAGLATGGFGIVSNQAVNSTPTACNVYTATSAPNDQYSECKVVASLNEGGGPCVRVSPGTVFGYVVHAYAGSTDLRKYYDGATSILGSGTGIAANDVVRLEAQGTLLTVKVNGATVIGPIDVAGAEQINSGDWGIYALTDIASEATIDNWRGGDFTGGAPDLTVSLQEAQLGGSTF